MSAPEKSNHIRFRYHVFRVAAIFIAAAADPRHHKVAVIVDRIQFVIRFTKPRMANTSLRWYHMSSFSAARNTQLVFGAKHISLRAQRVIYDSAFTANHDAP
jgi:hypothetical protein